LQRCLREIFHPLAFSNIPDVTLDDRCTVEEITIAHKFDIYSLSGPCLERNFLVPYIIISLQLNNGTNLFRIIGPGSLQGNDAAEALVAAFSDPHNGDDTYTEIPFLVDDTGISTPQADRAVSTPVQTRAPAAPLQYAPVGAIVLILGIMVWKRR
jgi:hypothetical protein